MADDQTWHLTVSYTGDQVTIAKSDAVNEEVSHITLNYTEYDDQITCTYTGPQDILRGMSRKEYWGVSAPTPLRSWLREKSCKLDSPDDGPTFVRRNQNGATVEEYYRNGELHRENGPARIARDPVIGSTTQGYYRDGERHRDDGPALVINFDSGGSVEEYYHADKEDREDGPSHVRRASDGSVTEEQYRRNGVLCREDGPADIRRFPNETVEFYYKDGRPILPPKVTPRSDTPSTSRPRAPKASDSPQPPMNSPTAPGPG